MKIKSSTPLLDMEGKEMTDGKSPFTIGVALANILLVDESGGKMKLFSLAQDFYKNDEVSLDVSDFALVKSATERTKAYQNALITGQILTYLESVKDEKNNNK